MTTANKNIFEQVVKTSDARWSQINKNLDQAADAVRALKVRVAQKKANKSN